MQRINFFRGSGVLALLLAVPAIGVAAPDKHQIFAVEHALSAAGYTLDSADGVMDQSTRDALRAFQEKRAGLSTTGEIDHDTLVALGVVREDRSYSEEVAKKAAAKVEPTFDPTTEKAPASEAKVEDGTDDEDDASGWLFSW